MRIDAWCVESRNYVPGSPSDYGKVHQTKDRNATSYGPPWLFFRHWSAVSRWRERMSGKVRFLDGPQSSEVSFPKNILFCMWFLTIEQRSYVDCGCGFLNNPVLSKRILLNPLYFCLENYSRKVTTLWMTKIYRLGLPLSIETFHKFFTRLLRISQCMNWDYWHFENEGTWPHLKLYFPNKVYMEIPRHTSILI